MEITQELVERIAHLARLTLSEEEKKTMTAQLENILGSVAALDKLVLEEETAEQVQTNVLRPDEEKQRVSREAMLSNAPETDGEYILIPNAMNQGGQG